MAKRVQIAKSMTGKMLCTTCKDLKEFPQLLLDAERGVMKCQICSQWPTLSDPRSPLVFNSSGVLNTVKSAVRETLCYLFFTSFCQVSAKIEN